MLHDILNCVQHVLEIKYYLRYIWSLTFVNYITMCYFQTWKLVYKYIECNGGELNNDITSCQNVFYFAISCFILHILQYAILIVIVSMPFLFLIIIIHYHYHYHGCCCFTYIPPSRVPFDGGVIPFASQGGALARLGIARRYESGGC